MKKKDVIKLSVPVLLSMILAMQMPLTALAKETNSSPAVSEITTDNSLEASENEQAELLKKAILAVKKKITIPDKMTEFSYNFYTSRNGSSNSYWRLNWSDKSYSESYNINVDLHGHITQYRYYSNPNSGLAGLPNYRKKDLEKTAFEFLKKIDSEISNQVKLESSTYSNGEYVYLYCRYVNGVKVENNDVRVSVNAVSGEISMAPGFCHRRSNG